MYADLFASLLAHNALYPLGLKNVGWEDIQDPIADATRNLIMAFKPEIVNSLCEEASDEDNECANNEFKTGEQHEFWGVLYGDADEHTKKQMLAWYVLKNRALNKAEDLKGELLS